MTDRKKSKKPKRIVLGVGHPWYSTTLKSGGMYDTIYLTKETVANSILWRGGETTVPLKYDGTGNWNKVRLVLEVLK